MQNIMFIGEKKKGQPLSIDKGNSTKCNLIQISIKRQQFFKETRKKKIPSDEDRIRST